ncbi:hypothetical protein FHW96_004846 [Novosphingobium sp. SG751A]|uniref:hypothetical protein n=1 Tax=Novosphingobium sp. SG751A TaxID=2587000 RepID=UPI0015531772|nr:hypothetical protein [Novosphingobium sp. SG751A]NOW48656.1 hypothetical protein [Novosphingobium sp. SG751A]
MSEIVADFLELTAGGNSLIPSVFPFPPVWPVGAPEIFTCVGWLEVCDRRFGYQQVQVVSGSVLVPAYDTAIGFFILTFTGAIGAVRHKIWLGDINQHSPPNQKPQFIPATRVLRMVQALCFAA